MKIDITLPTILKNELKMSGDLEENEKIHVGKGSVLNVTNIKDAGDSHSEVTATFFIYNGHFKERIPNEPEPEPRLFTREFLDMVKHHEGFRADAYICPAGVWTIGYGNTYYEDGRKVGRGDHITESEAEKLFINVLKDFREYVRSKVKVALNNNQLQALTSFTYNVGKGAFSNSTLLRKLNSNDYKGAAQEFPRWNKGGKRVLQGLVRRREDEKRLFES